MQRKSNKNNAIMLKIIKNKDFAFEIGMTKILALPLKIYLKYIYIFAIRRMIKKYQAVFIA